MKLLPQIKLSEISNRFLAVGLITALFFAACSTIPNPSPNAQPDADEITDRNILQAASLQSPGGLQVVSSDPVQNAFNVFPQASFTLKFNRAVSHASLEQGINLFTGRYDPSLNPKTFSKLSLTSLCNGRWRVQNPNAIPISFQWDVYEKHESSIGVVPAKGEAVFQSSTGEKTLRLYVGESQQSVKASNKSICSSTLFDTVWSEADKIAVITPIAGLGDAAYTLALSTGVRVIKTGESENKGKDDDDENDSTARLSQPFVLPFSTLNSSSFTATPSLELAAKERRILFENDKVVLFMGRDINPKIADLPTAFGTLYVAWKATNRTQLTPISTVGLGRTFSEAVATQDGKRAYVRAWVKSSNQDGAETLFWVDLISGHWRQIVNDKAQETGGLGFLTLAPDENTLLFLGSKAIEPTCPITTIECGDGALEAQVGYQAILGDYTTSSNPLGVGFQLKKYTENVPVESVPCFDSIGNPTVCSPTDPRATTRLLLGRSTRISSQEIPFFRVPALGAYQTTNTFGVDDHVNQDFYAIDFNQPGTEDQGNDIVAAASGKVYEIGAIDGSARCKIANRASSAPIVNTPQNRAWCFWVGYDQPDSQRLLYGYGRYVVLVHTRDNQTVYTIYGHLRYDSTNSIREGDVVTEGQKIGELGTTGHSTGPHLHWAPRSGIANNIYGGGYAYRLDPLPMNGAILAKRSDTDGTCPIDEFPASSSRWYITDPTKCPGNVSVLDANPKNLSLSALLPNDQNPSGSARTRDSSVVTVSNSGKKPINYTANIAQQPTNVGSISITTNASGVLNSGVGSSKAIGIELQCTQPGSGTSILNITSGTTSIAVKISVLCYGPILKDPNPSSLRFQIAPKAIAPAQTFTVGNTGNLGLNYIAEKTPNAGTYSTLNVTGGDGFIPPRGTETFSAQPTCNGGFGEDTYTITFTRKDKQSEKATLSVAVDCKAAAAPAKLTGPTPASDSVTALVAALARSSFTITNAGGQAMGFARGISDNSDPTVAVVGFATASKDSLAPNESFSQTLEGRCLKRGSTTVTASINAFGAGSGTFKLSVTCQGPLMTIPTATPASISARAGETVKVALKFSSTGETDLKYKYSLSASPDFVDLSLTPAAGTEYVLAPGKSSSVDFTATCKPDQFGSGSVTFTVTSTNGAGEGSVAVPVVCKDPKFGPVTPVSLTVVVGETGTGTFKVSNIGNFDLAYTTPLEITPATGAFSLLKTTSGDGVITQVTDGQAGSGSQEFTVTATCNKEGTDKYTIPVSRKDKPSVSVQQLVTLVCQAKPPKLGGPTPANKSVTANVDAPPVLASFEISNDGQKPMTWTRGITSKTGADIATIEWADNVSTGVLNEAEKATLTLRATCLKPGSAQAVVSITTAHLEKGTFTLDVTCKPSLPKLTANPVEIDSGAASIIKATKSDGSPFTTVVWTLVTQDAGTLASQPDGTAVFTAKVQNTEDKTVEIRAANTADPLTTISTTVKVKAITVDASAAQSPLKSAGSTTITAILEHDATAGGLKWELLNPIPGEKLTETGLTAVFQAASSNPDPYRTAQVRVSSLADPSKFKLVNIVVYPVKVVAVATPLEVQSKGTSVLSATVTNDAPQAGVTWEIVSGPGSVTNSSFVAADLDCGGADTVLQARSVTDPKVISPTITVKTNDVNCVKTKFFVNGVSLTTPELSIGVADALTCKLKVKLNALVNYSRALQANSFKAIGVLESMTWTQTSTPGVSEVGAVELELKPGVYGEKIEANTGSVNTDSYSFFVDVPKDSSACLGVNATIVNIEGIADGKIEKNKTIIYDLSSLAPPPPPPPPGCEGEPQDKDPVPNLLSNPMYSLNATTFNVGYNVNDIGVTQLPIKNVVLPSISEHFQNSASNTSYTFLGVASYKIGASGSTLDNKITLVANYSLYNPQNLPVSANIKPDQTLTVEVPFKIATIGKKPDAPPPPPPPPGGGGCGPDGGGGGGGESSPTVGSPPQSGGGSGGGSSSSSNSAFVDPPKVSPTTWTSPPQTALPTGSTNGDPHIATPDGLRYSPMHLGEFVYARSTLPQGIELQVRQQRLANYPAWASFNTAGAVKAGGHIFEVRLPSSLSPIDPMTLLIDGQVQNLTPGEYTLGQVVFRVAAGNDLTVFAVETDIPTDKSAQYGNLTTVQLTRKFEADLLFANQTEPIASLNVGMTTPLVGRYRGLFGVPDGDYRNDLTKPDGSLATTVSGMMESWRVQDRALSLFTYQNSQGPESFNLVQDQYQPTKAELAGANGKPNYVLQVSNLLQSTCQADLSKINNAFILEMALEMAAGRTANNLIATGLCYNPSIYRIINPQPPTSTLQLTGHVNLSSQAGIGVPGATVSISLPSSGQVLCVTTTNQSGVYSCRASFLTPSGGQTSLHYRISGRGAVLEQDVGIATPMASIVTVQSQDFAVQVQRVLHLTGLIRDAQDVPAAKARVLIRGIDTIEGLTDDTGHYNLFLPLPDGTFGGYLNYDATAANLFGHVQASSSFAVSPLGISEVSQDLKLEVTTPPAPVPDQIQTVTVKPRQISFTGRVVNVLENRAGFAGVKVVIDAPGSIQNGVCETTSLSGGAFTCTTTLFGENAFTAQVHANGFGAVGTQNVSVSNALMPIPGATTVLPVTDLEVRPNTIHFTGKISAAGIPLNGADIGLTVTSNNQSYSHTGHVNTNSGGVYEATLILPDDAGQNFTLTYTVVYQGTETKRIVGLALQPGVVNQQVLDVEVSSRTEVFTGKVSNALAGGLAISGATVTITRTTPTRIPICTTTTDKDGLYSCDYKLSTFETFTVDEQVSGFGTAKLEGLVVDPMQQSGVRFAVPHDFAVSPATIQVSGKVLDRGGLVAAGSEVTLTKGQNAKAVVKADSVGGYTAFLSLPDADLNGAINVQAAYKSPSNQVGSATSSVGVVGVIGTLSTVNQPLTLDLNIDSDQVSVFGQIQNTNAASGASGLGVTVVGVGSSSDVGTLCTTTTDLTGHYTCPAKSIVRRGLLETEISVRVAGQLVASPVPTSFTLIPGGNTVVMLAKNLVIAPTTLKLAGRVLDQVGRSVQDATVNLLGLTRATVQTDVQGDYVAFVVLPSSVTSGIIKGNARLNRYPIDASANIVDQAFNVEAGKLLELPNSSVTLPITAVRVKGSVKDASGTALSGASVLLTSAKTNSVTVTTDANGLYDVTFDLDSNITSLDFSLKASNTTNSSNQTITVPIVAAGPNVVTQDFVLENRIPGTARWEFALESGTRPTVSALGLVGTIYVVMGKYLYGSLASAELVAINPNGTLKWRKPMVGSSGDPQISIRDDGIILVSLGAKLAAFNTDGTTAWMYQHSSNFSGQMAVASDGTVYVGTQYSDMIAVDPSGTLKWSFRFPDYHYAINPVIGANGSIYISSAQGDLYAINPDGSQQWQRAQAGRFGMIAFAADGTIYTPGSNYPEGYQQGLLALRPDGSLKWINTDFPNGYNNYDLTVGADQIIYWNHGNSVLAVNPDGSTKTNLNLSGYNFVNGADGSHLIGTGSSILSVNDAGSTNWTFGLGYRVSAVALDGSIYTTDNGKLLAVNSSSFGLANSSWPSARHDNQNTARATQGSTPQRFVKFSGLVSKAYQINSPLAGYSVSVSRVGGSQVCQTTTLVDGSFICGAPITDLNGFDVQVLVTGRERNFFAVSSSTIASVPSGVANSTSAVVQNVAVPLTTLHVTGVVRNANGAPLSGVTVSLTATYNISSTVTLTTGSNGVYTTDFSFGTDTPNQAGLAFSVSQNGISTGKTQIVDLGAGVVTTQSTDFVLDSNVPGTSKWNYSTLGMVRSVALATDGTVVLGTIGSSGGTVVALNPDGSLRWTFPTGGFAPAVSIDSDGTIYVGSGDYYSGHLYALTASGSQKWAFTTARPLSQATVSEDGSAYVVADDGTLYAVNASNGQQLWSWSNHGVRSDQPITISQDGTVLVTVGYSNNLQAINPNGTPRWSVPNAGGAVAIGTDGTIYAGSNSLTAINQDGTTRWTAEGGNAVLGNDGTIYATTNFGIIAYNPTGAMLWRNGQSNGGFASIGADGIIYVSANNATLYAFDANGNEVWRYTGQGYGVLSPPIISSNGTIYVGTLYNNNSGQLYAISSSSRGLASSSWARFGKDNRNTSAAPFVDAPHRTLHFKGIVGNRNQPSSSLENYEVKISNANGVTLCTDTTDATGTYACSTPTNELDGFAVKYEITGALGIFTENSSISAGAANSSLDITRDLNLAITTLKITGQIKNGLGNAIANAKVIVNGVEKVADTNGIYSMFLTFDSATTDTSLAVTAQDEFNISNSNFDIPLTSGILNNKTLDLEIDARVPGNTRWSATLNGVIASTATPLSIGTDGTVYVGMNNKLLAMDAEGALKWEFTGSGYSVSQTSIGSDGTVYAADGLHLYALTPTGTQKWVFYPGTYGINFAPSIGTDGTLYLSVEGTLYALNSDGTVKWSVLSSSGNRFGRAAIGANGDLYVKTNDSLYAIKLLNGNQDWVFPLDNSGEDDLALASDGTIYLMQASSLVAIAPSGSKKWSFNLSGYERPIGAASVGTDGAIYFATNENNYALNSNGTLQWNVSTGGRYSSTAPIVGSDGTIYFQSECCEGSSSISAYSANGEYGWSKEIRNGAVLGSNGILYGAGRSSNILYAISTSSLGLANSSWSMINGNAQGTGRLP